MIRIFYPLKNCKLNCKLIGITTIVVAALIRGALAFAASKDFKLTYLLPKADIQWVQDLDSAAPDQGFDRYYLAEDPSIDILFSFSEEDPYKDFERDGLENFISQISRGKNIAQSMVSDNPVKLTKVNLKNEPPLKSISFQTEYALGQNIYSTSEVIYLYPNSGLHAILRWRQDSSVESLSKARQAFSKLQVKQKAENPRE